MSFRLEIPDSIANAMRLPAKELRRQLTIELAISLYSQGILSLGKACELADINKVSFSQLLGQRNIPRQYDESDLKDDLDYARSQ